jgi:glutamate racemase
MHIGVFDSGVGGEAVALALQKTFPSAKIDVVNDKANIPYGIKTPAEVIQLTERAIQPLRKAGCDIIVIACNTATTLALPTLRSRYPSQLFIGIEPMIKPAASHTRTGVIAVCATPATLASPRYHELVHKYAEGLTIVEPDCSEWAFLIENNQLNRSHIVAVIDEVRAKKADVIVLGCTHYHWIKEEIIELAGSDITVLEPSEAIGKRVTQLLSERAAAAN